jgi:5'-AMP-activated protein kinase regulatory beta subunit
MSERKSKKNPGNRSKSSVKRRRVKFSFVGNGAKAVALVGDFNNWNPEANPMKRDVYGIWSKEIMIPPGKYEYKFFVDGNWAEDPKNNQKDLNCFGTYNSVLSLAPK